jgi:hypothetical protein
MDSRPNLTDFRGWSQGRRLLNCRLVQYCGIEKIGAIDVPTEEIESQIEGLINEGMRVAWAEHNQRLFLRVWEHDGPEPPWTKVFAEEHLEDVEKLLRDLGLS